jgi:hypothetical protein
LRRAHFAAGVPATGDQQFLEDCGAEMLVETARLWLDLGFYSPLRGGKFCINGVTGPDEYNTVVNNNAYTNLMARQNLHYPLAGHFSLHAMLNAYWEPLAFGLPPVPASSQQAWRRCIDIALDTPHDICPWPDATVVTETEYVVQPAVRGSFCPRPRRWRLDNVILIAFRRSHQ